MITVLSVASELFPLIKTGGLADVAAALPRALAPEAVAMWVLIPGYPAVMRGLARSEVLHAFPDLFGGPARLLGAAAHGIELLIIDAPHLYDRPGGPYTAPSGGGASAPGWEKNRSQRAPALREMASDAAVKARMTAGSDRVNP